MEAKRPVQSSQVRMHSGAPALFVNDRPVAAQMYFAGNILHAEKSGRSHALSEFAARGITQFSCSFGVPLGGDPQAADRYAPIARHMDRILSHSPDALVLPRLCLPTPWRKSEPWLHAWYEGEQMLHRDDEDDPGVEEHVSFSSPRRWQDWQRELPPLLRFLEQRYGAHMLGYHLGEAATSEWAYTWLYDMSDFSEPQQRAFRAWLRRRYGNDQAALRAAWRDDRVTFHSASIPADRQRRAGQPAVRDPAAERPVLDYIEFHSLAAARLACRSCSLAKRTLAGIGSEKICGVCYGYHLKRMGSPRNLFNTGHQAMGMLLEHPDVDFIEAPYNYQWRHSGGIYCAQLLAGSLRLHNTLYICEDDTFTFLSRKPPWKNQPTCPDRRTTIGVLTRNHMGVLQDAGGLWWMDLRGENWFNDHQLMNRLAELARLGADSQTDTRIPTAEIAVVMDEESLRFYRQDKALMDCLNGRQILELGYLGAPCDYYRLHDLPRLLDQTWSRRYRLFVFIDALHVPDEIRACIAERLSGGGRTLLWTYAAGLATEAGLSVDAMSRLVGIPLREYDYNGPALVETCITGERRVYGTNAIISPIFYPCGPDLTVEGWLLNVEKPGLATREFAGWQSVWSSAPAVSAPVLRKLARRARVHVYNERGDQVLRCGKLLGVHAGCSGACTVKAPGAVTWRNAFSGTVEARDTAEITIDLRRGDTHVWRITPQGED